MRCRVQGAGCRVQGGVWGARCRGRYPLGFETASPTHPPSSAPADTWREREQDRKSVRERKRERDRNRDRERKPFIENFLVRFLFICVFLQTRRPLPPPRAAPRWKPGQYQMARARNQARFSSGNPFLATLGFRVTVSGSGFTVSRSGCRVEG